MIKRGRPTAEDIQQKTLENDIRFLKRNKERAERTVESLQHRLNHEDHVHGVVSSDGSRVGVRLDGNSLKRPRQVEANESSKRLRSTVLNSADLPSSSATLEPERPKLRISGEDVNRQRRFLGSLLIGTLDSIQKTQEKEREGDTMRKRQQVTERIENKVEDESKKLWEEEKKKIVAKREEHEERLAQINADIEEKENKLHELITSQRLMLLSHFAKTSSEPHIYFIPSKLDHWTETEFGLKPPQPETAVDDVHNNNGDDGDGDGEDGEDKKSGEEGEETKERKGTDDVVVVEDIKDSADNNKETTTAVAKETTTKEKSVNKSTSSRSTSQ